MRLWQFSCQHAKRTKWYSDVSQTHESVALMAAGASAQKPIVLLPSLMAQRQGVRLVSRGTSVQIRFGSPFSSNVVVCGQCLVILTLIISEILKWLSSLPILMQESFWWWQCSDRYIIYLSPHLRTPFGPFSPSLIRPMVSVDHVYLLYLLTGPHYSVDESKYLTLPSEMSYNKNNDNF